MWNVGHHIKRILQHVVTIRTVVVHRLAAVFPAAISFIFGSRADERGYLKRTPAPLSTTQSNGVFDSKSGCLNLLLAAEENADTEMSLAPRTSEAWPIMITRGAREILSCIHDTGQAVRYWLAYFVRLTSFNNYRTFSACSGDLVGSLGEAKSCIPAFTAETSKRTHFKAHTNGPEDSIVPYPIISYTSIYALATRLGAEL